MESLATDGEDPAHCLDMDPGQCRRRAPHRSKVRICVKSVQLKAEQKKTQRAPSQNMAPLSVTQPEAGLVAVEAPWSPRESGGESQLAVDLISGPGLILQHTFTQLV